MPMSLKNVTVGEKLLLGFLSIALLVAVMGYFGVRGTREISRSFDVAANSSTPAIRALLEIKSTANEIAAQIAGFQLIGDALSREEGTDTGAQKHALIGKVEKIDRWAERYERAMMRGEGHEQVTFARKLREAEAGVVIDVFELLGLKERGISGTELVGKTQELAIAQDRLEEVIAEAIDYELTHIKEHNVSVSSTAETMLRVNVWLSVLTLAFAASVGLVFARSIGRPIRRLKESVERFEIGQAGESAHVTVSSGDEIGQLWRSFNQMTERLEKTAVSRDMLAHELVERQKAEQALAAENTFRRAIENSARAGIVAIDLEGKIIYANRSFCDMVGWSEDEVLGALPPLKWWPPEETDTIKAGLQDILAGKAPTDGTELRFQRRNGERFDVLVLAAPLKGDNQTTGWLASSYDITDRKRAAAALVDINRRLADALTELHRTQDQVIQQERLRAVGTMASGIAHDFNNCLVPIVAYSDLLLRDNIRPADDKARQFIRAIRTSAESAVGVVSRLNDLYRSRDPDEVFGPVAISTLVREVTELTQPRWKDQAQAKGITIEFQTDFEEELTLSGDKSAILNLLTNLVFNAVHAMPDGGAITIRTRRVGDHATIEVTDTGLGMTEEVRQLCLEPFFSTKGEAGTGMGLAVVHGIVQRHSGTMDIGTELGKGTTFTLKLPLAEPMKTTAASFDREDPAFPKLRILAVDDDLAVLQTIAEILRTAGHSVVMAQSGREALENFRASEFDAVLTDRAMPEVNGDKVAEAIKRLAPGTPIIMLTGFGELMESAGEMPAGVDLIITKPFTAVSLQRELANLAPV